MFLKYFTLIVSLFCLSFSEPVVITNYNYYNIYPDNIHKLEDSMDKTSPLVNIGSIRHATVNWKIKYIYKRESKNGVCSIADVKTKIDVLYTIPKIAKNHKSPKGTKGAFSRYYTVLKEYLDKHKDFAVEAAEEIEKKLVMIKPYPRNCDVIKSNVKTVANKIIKKYKRKNKDFEIRTYEGFLDSVRTEKL